MITCYATHADCLLPDAKNFSEFVEKIELREGWERSITRHANRLSKYKFRSKVDSLFEFANDYFKERLPDDIICSRVDVRDRTWFSFSDAHIIMNYAFYLTPQADKHSHRIMVQFAYSPRSGTMTANFRKDFWIPDCRSHPDSCKFEVISKRQAMQIAKDVGFVTQYYSFHTGSQQIPPFHFEVYKPIDDDCGMQSLYINSYNGDTIHSARYNRYDCVSWKDKIDYSDLVIDGTVLEQKSFSIQGQIYTTTRIEVHHLFKGELSGNIVVAISPGGKVPGRSMSLSHPPPSLGTRYGRYVFFLHRNQYYLKELEACDELLGSKVYFAVGSAVDIPTPLKPDTRFWRPTEEHLLRIENITGISRKKILHPQTWNEKVLSERMTIPDREAGIAATMTTVNAIFRLNWRNDF